MRDVQRVERVPVLYGVAPRGGDYGNSGKKGLLDLDDNGLGRRRDLVLIVRLVKVVFVDYESVDIDDVVG